ncbi:MAG: hypothetical protein N3D12_02890 [Candidatus Methanomethyliaceae archaeon]|nr:hypothetical protein [Candidatus Methanomethyliaceae archaeon]
MNLSNSMREREASLEQSWRSHSIGRSLDVPVKVKSNDSTKHLLEVLCLILSFVVIAAGYLMSGSVLPMVFKTVVSFFILGIVALAFVLSYLMPKTLV